MSSENDDYRIESAANTGGLLFDDPKEGEMLRRSLQYLIHRVGGQVMAGNMNFGGMSMPVHLNEPRSLLERITDDWAYAPYYLTAAAATTDPIERIKLVAAFAVSGLHCLNTLAKPFNPILGSTYQTTLADGTPCFVEQTSHHPPVTHYLIQPQSGEYTLAGFSGIDAGIAWGLDTGIYSRRIGINVVQFVDGSRIVYNLPRMLVRGLGAERKCEFLGPFSVYYEAHNLVFDLLIDPPQPFRWGFSPRMPSDYMDGVLYSVEKRVDGEGEVMFSGAFAEQKGNFFGNPDGKKNIAEDDGYVPIELRTDADVSNSVTNAKAIRDSPTAGRQIPLFAREVICFARGTFLGYLDIDGKRVWDIRETPKSELIPQDLGNALGSDCRHREDVIALRKAVEEEENIQRRDELTESAQMLKEKLENIQRKDRKLRSAGLEEDGTQRPEAAGGEAKGAAGCYVTSAAQVQEMGKKETDGHDNTPFFPKSLGGL